VKRLLLALALVAGPAAVPEPAGYRMGDYNAPVPDTLRGAAVIHADALPGFITVSHPVLIDVLPAPRRPDGMPADRIWLPLPHKDIPGSVWLPDVGRGAISPTLEAFFTAQLHSLTAGHEDRPVVFYCRAACWMSWNAARRAVLQGYSHVAWFPDGVEGWTAVHQPLSVATALYPAVTP
jgi:PQQ-dependent catabolism-associated CXXCW motif protein